MVCLGFLFGLFGLFRFCAVVLSLAPCKVTFVLVLWCKKRKRGKEEFCVTYGLVPKTIRENLPQKKFRKDKNLKKWGQVVCNTEFLFSSFPLFAPKETVNRGFLVLFCTGQRPVKRPRRNPAKRLKNPPKFV